MCERDVEVCVSEGCGGACVSEGYGLLPQETQERIL